MDTSPEAVSMTDEEALLQAIVADPDDDLPRLVYSDWLEEQGNPRGEFIRAQCALARLPVDAPQRLLLVARQTELFSLHKTEWLRPIDRLVDRAEFHRGFVSRVTMTPRTFVTSGEFLFRHEPISEVHFYQRLFLSAGDISALANCPLLRRLTAFKMNTDRGIRDDDVELLVASPHLTSLRSLDLSDNWITDRGAFLLAESPYLDGLRMLQLSGNPIYAMGKRVLRARFRHRVTL